MNSAPSVELPFFIFYIFKHPRFILIESDPLLKPRQGQGWYKLVHSFLKKRAYKVIYVHEEIYTKTERLPFVPFDEIHELEREAWWQRHLTELSS